MEPTPEIPATPHPPSALDELIHILASWGVTGVTLALAALPLAVAITGYILRNRYEGKIDNLEGKVDLLEATIENNQVKAKEKYDELDKKYQDLDKNYQDILRGGTEIQTQRQEIIAVAEEIKTRLGATDCAVLVPAPTSIAGDKPNELVFLYASGAQAVKLRRVRVPIEKSLSGSVYQSGETKTDSPPTSGSAFASRVDKVTHHTTSQTLSVCLRYKTERFGVAQFLNKHNGQRFDREDERRAQDQCTALAPLVANFLADPRRLIELGHAPRRKQIEATIMLVDLTNYGALFDELDSSAITDLLNEYFQELCTIALLHGGFIDQFVGDGVLLTFNVFRSQDAHQSTAFAAAVEMRTAFRNLRAIWQTLGYPKTDSLFVRIGLSCGLVTMAEVGHAQARRTTVIGPAVNAAADACQSSSRDCDVIVLTPKMKESVANDPELDGVEETKMDKESFYVLR